MRKSNEELKEICKKYSVDTLWSWSRVHTYMTSQFEYFLNYVKHIPTDNDNCAYAPLGGLAHGILEDYYEGKINYDEMINDFENGWMINIDLADLKFDRNSTEKNNNIKNKYKDDLVHFFKNHNPINDNKKIEQFILIKLRKDIVLQGYIDILITNKNKEVVIGDFKTSTIYKGKKALEECGQLALYAIGIHQLGIPLEKIKIGWNFLKYQNVTVEQKNGKKKVREIERSKLGESLKSSVTTWLKHFKYENINDYILHMINDNSIDCLPNEVKEKFEFDDCWVYVDVTAELLQNWKDLVIKTIDEIVEKTNEYKLTKDNKMFWDNEVSVKNQSYYYSTLCGYSANLLLPYKQYLDKLENDKKGLTYVVTSTDKDNSEEIDIDDFLSELLSYD